MKNSDRLLVDYLYRHAERHGLNVAGMSDEWIFLLQRGGVGHVVFGYDLGLNSSTAHRVANDKAATSDVLRAGGVPAVEHRVFLHPRYAKHLSRDGNWRDIQHSFEDWGRDVVVKPNEGTGGIDVYRVRTPFELELAVQNILVSERSLCLAPYLEVSRETRVVLLDDEPVLAYEKQIATVTGDGRSTLARLMAEQLSAEALAAIFEDRHNSGSSVDIGGIPASGTEVPVHWKHNLGQSAAARLVDPSLAVAEASLACRAARAIGLRFGSVDIVETPQGPLVLEVNSGVMVEAVLKRHPRREEMLDRIYGAAMEAVVALIDRKAAALRGDA